MLVLAFYVSLTHNSLSIVIISVRILVILRGSSLTTDPQNRNGLKHLVYVWIRYSSLSMVVWSLNHGSGDLHSQLIHRIGMVSNTLYMYGLDIQAFPWWSGASTMAPSYYL